MNKRDLHLLPRFSDGLTFLYVERARIEQDQAAIVLIDDSGRVPVPVAALSVLMLGPGVSITHAAVVACCDNGCSVVWTGEAGFRCYASGLGETRRTAHLLDQARIWADASAHMQTVRRMYTMRFSAELDPMLTLEQVRGLEGMRVRETYARMSAETGVPWSGRAYGDQDWSETSAVNRALSVANSCLYGLCHAAIVSIGMSPGLGFVHTGKSLAFVYDIADLYKCEITIPLAFRSASAQTDHLDTSVRRACRDAFRRTKLMQRVIPDMQRALGLQEDSVFLIDTADDDPTVALWDPSGDLPGARNYSGGDDA